MSNTPALSTHHLTRSGLHFLIGYLAGVKLDEALASLADYIASDPERLTSEYVLDTYADSRASLIGESRKYDDMPEWHEVTPDRASLLDNEPPF
jgi:hypothetical protein